MTRNFRQSYHIIGLFLKFIWQFSDVVEFRSWGRMLPWQQHFEGHVLLKFELLTYFVDLIGLRCLGLFLTSEFFHFLFLFIDIF